jgi:hypothetical protein
LQIVEEKDEKPEEKKLNFSFAENSTPNIPMDDEIC